MAPFLYCRFHLLFDRNMNFFDIFARQLRPLFEWDRQPRRVRGGGVFVALTLAASAVEAVNCMNNLPASNPDASYQVDAAAGVVTDTRTILMWKRTEEAKTMTWAPR